MQERTLRATQSVALPLLAVGNVRTFTVTVPGAKVGMAALANAPAAMAGSVSLDATVAADDTVVVSVQALLAVAAGTQSFTVVVV